MRYLLPLLMLAALTASAAAHASTHRESASALERLDISEGHWVFHGRSIQTVFSKAGTWTWHEDCRWSGDHLFLECGFNNDWSGRIVKSLVVDTYNDKDQTYWHYEFFAVGASGDHPFVSRMTIHHRTWIEYGHAEEHGKRIKERIVYHFLSPTRVAVQIELSKDGRHWVTVDKGKGSRRT